MFAVEAELVLHIIVTLVMNAKSLERFVISIMLATKQYIGTRSDFSRHKKECHLKNRWCFKNDDAYASFVLSSYTFQEEDILVGSYCTPHMKMFKSMNLHHTRYKSESNFFLERFLRSTMLVKIIDYNIHLHLI